MTDDHKKTVEKQLQNNQIENAQAQKSLSNNANMPTNTQSNAARPDAKVTSAPEPQIKKVDIAIAGVTYPIYCPVHEQEELHAAVSYINDFALNLKRDAPSLSQESLLVLSCLNLYEKIQTHERNAEDRTQQDKQSVALLNKVIQDAHSIL